MSLTISDKISAFSALGPRNQDPMRENLSFDESVERSGSRSGGFVDRDILVKLGDCKLHVMKFIRAH